jgi:Tol biopolymer transport system component/predicted Ser/Thr protein kinase
MSLTSGTKLGPYEILAPIGAGGMGEVYKARDTRLDRLVAIKVSKEKFSERFESEARSIAALNHPNICTLHDVGPDYLVMEYVEGHALKGPLPLDQTLKYAAQICEALDAAHKKGITHRDLKPANILVTKAGVKLLDFGLARIAASPDETMTMAVMGTPAYMAPEQWDGKPGDARSDIYALGCVLYEILTGKRVLPERGAVEPAALESVIRTCLEKDADERWQSAHDVKRALALAGQTSTLARLTKNRADWAAWAVAAVGAGIALFFGLRPAAAPPAAEVVRLSLNPPENASFTGASIATVGVPQFAVSPDGRSIVFVASVAGAKPMLWLRSLEAETARVIPGTDGADYPMWSPDSRWIGFFADGELKKVPASGGPALAFADAPDPRGGSWGPEDTVLFGTGTQGIYRVSASGGPVKRVTERDVSRQEGSHRTPAFLADGNHFLFTVRSGQTEQTGGVYAGSLDGKTKKPMIRGNTNSLYSPSGHLLFMDGDTLMGQAFDADRLELRGQAFVIESHVGLSSITNGAVSVSGAGILAYAGTLSETGRLTWFDRSGSPSGSVGPPGDYIDFRLSPDQTRLAASLVDPKAGAPNIWLMDLALGNPAPFTFGGFFNAEPVWSPKGDRILFRAFRSGGFVEFFSKSAGGGGKEEPVLPEQASRAAGVNTTVMIPWDWSPDGRHLLYSVIGGDSGLWLLPLAGDPKPVKFLSSPGDQLHGNFSPDGKLVAYSSSESGRFEVHVQTVPLSDRQWVVSTAGGSMPRWRADGRELYYISLDWKLMVVPVGPGPSFGVPRQLFQTHVPRNASFYRTHYVPSRDGQRFLINTLAADLPPVSITVVLNWTAGLKK